MPDHKFIFATYAETDGQLHNVHRLAVSLRTFGGNFSASPIRLYIPRNAEIKDRKFLAGLNSFGIEIIDSRLPEEAAWLFYAGKVYAAAEAEAAAEKDNAVLIWLDEDTMILSEPAEFELGSGTCLAYCPVMHNRSGSSYDIPPDTFWSRIYKKLEIADDRLFPMMTPADDQKIRAYFHVGLLVVRPERGILRRWVNDFEILYNDPDLVEMCRNDVIKKIFLHQTAMVGVLHIVARNEMHELPGTYNYPIFFEKQYESERKFDSIENAVTIRSVVSLEKIGESWHQMLAGPPEKVAWLKKWLPGHTVG